MNIIVIGMGQVGHHIASVLVSEKHDVTLIDSSEAALAAAQETLDAITLVGHGGSIRTLIDAHTGSTDLLIAATDNDEVNVLASLMAKKMGATRVIARVSDTENTLGEGDATHWPSLLGIDLVISPERLTAIEIHRIIENPGALWVERFAEDRIELIRVRVGEDRETITGVPLAKLEIPRETLVTAIWREEHLIVPDGRETIRGGDELFLIGSTEALPAAEEYLTGPRRPTAKVAIIGGTRIGYWLARFLDESNIETILVERDADHAQYLAGELDRTIVLKGDGTNRSFLVAEGLDNVDAFISVTKSDETNLMSGLLARRLGVGRTIAIAHRPDYAQIYQHLGIDVTISPRLLAANQILRYVRAGKVLSVTVLAEGAVEIIEIEAVRGAKLVGRSLRELDLPRGAVIGAIATDERVIVPHGEDTIPEKSRVVFFTTPAVRPAVERMFRRKTGVMG